MLGIYHYFGIVGTSKEMHIDEDIAHDTPLGDIELDHGHHEQSNIIYKELTLLLKRF
jgi:hypothetical protein